MLEKNQLIALFKATANADAKAPVAYNYNGENLTYAAMNETLRNELNELVGSYNLYRNNKNTFFELVETALTDILPAKVQDRYAQFAEVKTMPQGAKAVFTRKMGKMRAKQFVTRVGLAGVYEVFKLAHESFEVTTSAIGGAYQIGFEEFLDGRANLNEVMEIIMEGMDELIYREIAKALMASVGQLPAANKVVFNGFDEQLLDQVISVVSAYGNPVIYCTREFAVKMIPATGWISESMKDARWATGYLGNYKGCQVVILPQSFEDETNAKKVIDPGFVWVMPSGNEKPVKVVFEGQMHMRERENDDWSRDFQVYQKVGIGVMMTNNIGSYIDESLKNALDTIVSKD